MRKGERKVKGRERGSKGGREEVREGERGERKGEREVKGRERGSKGGREEVREGER